MDQCRFDQRKLCYQLQINCGASKMQQDGEQDEEECLKTSKIKGVNRGLAGGQQGVQNRSLHRGYSSGRGGSKEA